MAYVSVHCIIRQSDHSVVKLTKKAEVSTSVDAEANSGVTAEPLCNDRFGALMSHFRLPGCEMYARLRPKRKVSPSQNRIHLALDPVDFHRFQEPEIET